MIFFSLRARYICRVSSVDFLAVHVSFRIITLIHVLSNVQWFDLKLRPDAVSLINGSPATPPRRYTEAHDRLYRCQSRTLTRQRSGDHPARQQARLTLCRTLGLAWWGREGDESPFECAAREVQEE